MGVRRQARLWRGTLSLVLKSGDGAENKVFFANGRNSRAVPSGSLKVTNDEIWQAE